MEGNASMRSIFGGQLMEGGAIVAMELESVHRLVQEHGSDLAFAVNHSGGKDSTRMLGFVRNQFPDSPTYTVMADTGFEHRRPISAADFARERCAEFGLNLTVVRNPKRTYLEMVERRGMFPSPRFRQCTSDLKRSPIEKFIRTLPHKFIVNCIGIRAEESHSRSRLSPLGVNASLTTRDRTVYNWLPIFDQSLADVLAWHWVNAVRLHPVYVPDYHKDGTKGGYLRRFSAGCASFQRTPTFGRSTRMTALRSSRSAISNPSWATRCVRVPAWFRSSMPMPHRQLRKHVSRASASEPGTGSQ
jgi:3'-phosphoadenosine 5'-phosphosulfate sulfotransferase (PAPS reductase)/FAD synthetase